MKFGEFFKAATGYETYRYQCRLAYGEKMEGESESAWLSHGTACESRLISIPTGLGKTAAVALAWLCDRLVHSFNPQLLGMASSPHLLSGDADPCGADCSGS